MFKINVDKLYDYIFLIFLLFTMFFPVSFTSVKILMMLVLFTSFFVNRGLVIPHEYSYILLYVFANIVFIFWGMFNKTPGYLSVTTVDVIYPLALPLLFLPFCRQDMLKKIAKVIVIAGFLISCYDILFVLSEMGIFSVFKRFYIDELNLLFSNYSYIHFSSSHLNTLYFSFPFSIAMLFDDRTGKFTNSVSKRFVVISIVVQIICIVLSTRLALIVLALASPVLVFILNRAISGKKKRKKMKMTITKLLIISFVLIITVVVLLQFKDYFFVLRDFISNKLVAELGNESDEIRSIQSEALLQGWLESPLIGNGAGATLGYLIRSEEMPWAYERTYEALLFQKGIFGFVVYFVLYIKIFRMCFTMASKNEKNRTYGIGLAAGFVIFLIANANDPYLAKFGYMWVLFLPFCFGSSLKYSTEPVCEGGFKHLLTIIDAICIDICGLRDGVGDCFRLNQYLKDQYLKDTRVSRTQSDACNQFFIPANSVSGACALCWEV